MFLQHVQLCPSFAAVISAASLHQLPLRRLDRARAGSGRRSNPCRGLSCEHLDSPQHFHVAHILKIPQISHRPRGGGDFCVFATRGYILRTVLHFSSQPQITLCSAGRGPTIWSPMLRIKSWSGLYIEVHHSAMQTR